jgi:hypothetical protein
MPSAALVGLLPPSLWMGRPALTDFSKGLTDYSKVDTLGVWSPRAVCVCAFVPKLTGVYHYVCSKVDGCVPLQRGEVGRDQSSPPFPSSNFVTIWVVNLRIVC